MEFQEALMKLKTRKTDHEAKQSPRHSVSDAKQSPRLSVSDSKQSPTSKVSRRWKILSSSFSSSSSDCSKSESKPPPPPLEFLCSISGSLMADPVIVSSGHTFERACVQSCTALRFRPTLLDTSTPDFTTVIPNLALKSAILSWCEKWSEPPPKPLDSASAEQLVRELMASQNKLVVLENELYEGVRKNPPVDKTRRRSSHFYSSSDESSLDMIPAMQLATCPSCRSFTSTSTTTSSSSSEIEIANTATDCPEKEIVVKMKSQIVSDVQDGVVWLRKITREREETRAHLCSTRILSALRSLIVSRYNNIQVNSVAALVNLSLEKVNKVKIVRSGLVLPLIDVLKGGFPESQEHAAGAIFSLALDDQNKIAIGVLGALPPLIHLLRSETERTRHDSALALYHLSLVQSNVTRLVKLGSVNVFVGMVKSGHMTSRVLLILCNLASCADGRAAMLDAGAVDCLAGVLRSGELDSEASRDNCVAALFGLSHGGWRFKGLAKAAGLAEELRKVEKIGSEKAKEKAARIAEAMKEKEEVEKEAVDWEELLDSGFSGETRSRLGGGMEWFSVNSA